MGAVVVLVRVEMWVCCMRGFCEKFGFLMLMLLLSSRLMKTQCMTWSGRTNGMKKKPGTSIRLLDPPRLDFHFKGCEGVLFFSLRLKYWSLSMPVSTSKMALTPECLDLKTQIWIHTFVQRCCTHDCVFLHLLLKGYSQASPAWKTLLVFDSRKSIGWIAQESASRQTGIWFNELSAPAQCYGQIITTSPDGLTVFSGKHWIFLC